MHFLKHLNHISSRTPAATSLSRATGFNKTNVQQLLFYDNLEAVIKRSKFQARFMYNVGQTGLTRVHKAPTVLEVATYVGTPLYIHCVYIVTKSPPKAK